MLKQVIKGILTYIPGFYRLSTHHLAGGQSFNSDYCYSVWLRHCSYLVAHGMSYPPESVVELGPGNSFGVGLAAHLFGANKYVAVDRLDYGAIKENLNMLLKLRQLIESQRSIPDDENFPNIKPKLSSYDFPAGMKTDASQGHCSDQYLAKLKEDMLNEKGEFVSFVDPSNFSKIPEHSVDLVISQAVLEHVDALGETYGQMKRIIKPGGYMSHSIDFKSHGMATCWNGHWGYSQRYWKMIRGKRPFLINRQPWSRHLELIEQNGFQVEFLQPYVRDDGISREDLSKEFTGMTDDDLHTAGVFLVARKI